MFQGIGDDMDGLLNFMDEEKILDPFLSWLAWFTDLVVDKEEGKSEEEAEPEDVKMQDVPSEM